ncbi:MAG: aminomethyl-transferring glycine dehydrogenase [Proteobacteria bacterium]|nr:aminomethyl-transferring glycine dehydrogenase [Pseudomonadota bacterium]
MNNSPLDSLTPDNEFPSRHIGPRENDIREMLDYLGEESLESLVTNTLPKNILSDEALDLAPAISERQALQRLREMAAQNRIMHNMIGMGYHDTVMPAVVQRNVFENPGWYTSYTPYQAEISQGRLEALLNFQQLIIDMSGMEIANASLLDEATAAAEAMAMIKRANRRNRSLRFLMDPACLPQTQDVVINRAEHFDYEVVVADSTTSMAEQLSAGDFFGALVQYPGTDGAVPELAGIIEAAHAQNALVAVAADLLSLALLTPPGELGADIVLGNAQRFGVPLGYGGPHAAFFAVRDEYKRTMPGRVIGVSQDSHGKHALRMALQTREQHIRRDKATSNICTAQALLAILSSFYAAWHGPVGIKKIASRVHRLTCILETGLSTSGFNSENKSWFDTLSYQLDAGAADAVYGRALAANINLRRMGETGLGISINEKTDQAEIEAIWNAFCGADNKLDFKQLDQQLATDLNAIPAELKRQSEFLSHPVFNSYHSETEMMRYMKRLENKDISLKTSMISLGSCTMKLNAASEMEPVSWPGFAAIHPFAPLDQTQGYQQLFTELEQMLVACTGYDAVSLQPNAGSQGEYAGLLAIKAYHQSRGDGHRNICLIPSSAHGTNPASAAMAGMKIIVTKCDANGNVDVDDLKAKAEQHKDNLSALMVTYPSTHGVYEERIREICEIIHANGGQIYLDGANLNALVGCAAPGKFGADVSHLNLHKTFAIPHGGGGPGVGPICVGKHLAPFVPNHSVQAIPGPSNGMPAVAAAPWGSAGILPISWAYIAMLGQDGMKKSTQVAILNANYMAKQLSSHFDVLYTGRNEHVAHECIIDLRPFKESCGISEEDVAKRLIDYGFHAPTMSFPVPGTLMIEPTESESLDELKRFCTAMKSIHAEIMAVENETADKLDNPLKNAPHTVIEVTTDNWTHAYSRSDAAWPVEYLRDNKYWAPVGRVDNAWGDRNLMCACPPIESYIDES